MRASLIQAMEMAEKIGQVFLATADSRANPHLSIVQPVGVDDQGRWKLMAWFCRYALSNLQENPKVSVVIWDPAKDTGYQLTGQIEDLQLVAELDGYAAGIEQKKHFPQTEWKILVRIDKVFNFQKAPHVDVEV